MRPFFHKLSAILTQQEQQCLFMLALADILTGLLDVGFLAALLLLVNTYTHTGNLPVNQKISRTLSYYDPLLVTGVFLLLYGLKNLAAVLFTRAQHHFVFKVASRLSKRNLLQYLHGTYLDYINTDSSVRVRQITQMPIEFAQYVLANLQAIIAQGILILFTVGAIMLYHPALFLMLFALLLPPVVLLGKFIKRRLSKVRTQIKASSVSVIQYLQEALAGYIESNVFGKHTFFADRFNQSQLQLNNGLATQLTWQSVSSRVMELFAITGFFILILLNRFTGRNGVDLLSVGVFMAAAYKIIPGMVKMLNSAGQIKTYSFTLDGLLPENEIGNKQTTTAPTAINSVAFENVSFWYNEKPVLNQLNFRAERGNLVGISGISGGGKTTLINLMLGFLSRHEGDIYMNEQPVTAAERKAFWPRIAYVKQQGFFINDTIRTNITLNSTNIDEKQLSNVLRICGLDVLLQTDPDGLNKQLQENGKNISGGQRQRLMLARALYHDFDLLILDEPFSEMDEAAERAILMQLKTLQHNKLLFFISHNRKSLEFCDQIIVLDAA